MIKSVGQGRGLGGSNSAEGIPSYMGANSLHDPETGVSQAGIYTDNLEWGFQASYLMVANHCWRRDSVLLHGEHTRMTLADASDCVTALGQKNHPPSRPLKVLQFLLGYLCLIGIRVFAHQFFQDELGIGRIA